MASRIKSLKAHDSREEVTGTGRGVCGGHDILGQFRDKGNQCAHVGNVVIGIYEHGKSSHT